jgi:archaemetzincin
MKYLYVGAIGDTPGGPDRAALDAIGRALGGAFAGPLREVALPPIDFAYDARRNQYGSIPVLERLLATCPPDAHRLLAVTERDLFIPVLTFVYGQAQLNGVVAVMSLARLRQEFYGLPPDGGVLCERAAKEALHETGHTYGLVHCLDRGCAMALSTNVRQVDGKRAAFCASCAARLERSGRERSL